MIECLFLFHKETSILQCLSPFFMCLHLSETNDIENIFVELIASVHSLVPQSISQRLNPLFGASVHFTLPPTSLLTPHTSHIAPHTSHLTPHTTHLTPHTSHLRPRPHTSHLRLRPQTSDLSSLGPLLPRSILQCLSPLFSAYICQKPTR